MAEGGVVITALMLAEISGLAHVRVDCGTVKESARPLIRLSRFATYNARAPPPSNVATAFRTVSQPRLVHGHSVCLQGVELDDPRVVRVGKVVTVTLSFLPPVREADNLVW